ncbi:MAG: signal peptidase I [Candidatus Pacebacteria bacterium]|nr:signal peptidase I [Candidatus Paceibacterota bacterium]
MFQRRSKAAILTGEPPALIALVLILWSTLLYLVISNCIVGSATIAGTSMKPTLEDGSRVLVLRWMTYLRLPARGEIVALSADNGEGYYVKRVIGLPGDSVTIRGGHVFLNGKKLWEPYLEAATSQTFVTEGSRRSIKVPPRHLFVLGDNRADSTDSRDFGPIAAARIRGIVKPWLTLSP